MSTQILKLLGSFSFGGALGAGLAGLAQNLALLGTATTDVVPVFLTGAFLGTALWRPVESAWSFFVAPRVRRIRLERAEKALREYREKGLITSEQVNELMGRLLEQDLAVPPAPASTTANSKQVRKIVIPGDD
jgi:hypothetical protein